MHGGHSIETQRDVLTQQRDVEALGGRGGRHPTPRGAFFLSLGAGDRWGPAFIHTGDFLGKGAPIREGASESPGAILQDTVGQCCTNSREFKRGDTWIRRKPLPCGRSSTVLLYPGSRPNQLQDWQRPLAKDQLASGVIRMKGGIFCIFNCRKLQKSAQKSAQKLLQTYVRYGIINPNRCSIFAPMRRG